MFSWKKTLSYTFLLAAVVLVVEGVDPGCSSPKCVAAVREVLSLMNSSNDPCKNPYEFACGGWLDSFQRPPSETSWTISFSEIAKRQREKLRDILENDSSNSGTKVNCSQRRKSAAGSNSNGTSAEDSWSVMMKCHYQFCMDTESRNTHGVASLDSFLQEKLPFLLEDALLRKENPSSLFVFSDEEPQRNGDLLAQIHRVSVSVFFDVYVSVNPLSESKLQQLHFWQAGLGLSYDQYDDAGVLQAYREHLQSLLSLYERPANASNAKNDDAARINEVIKIEQDLRSIHLTPVQLRDPIATVNPVTLEKFQLLSPRIDWKTYTHKLDDDAAISSVTSSVVVLHNREYYASLGIFLTTKWSPKAVRDYVLVHTLQAWTSNLDTTFRQEFDDFRKAVYGVEPQPLWRQCLDTTSSALGWILSREFLKQRQSNALLSKHQAEAMTNQIRKAFREGLGELTWMDAKTKKGALSKEEAITPKMDFPDWLMNPDRAQEYFAKFYGDVTQFSDSEWKKVFQDDFTLRRMLQIASRRFELKQLGEEPDRTLWAMPPLVVNAYYSNSLNEIVFLGAILQPPFYRLFDNSNNASSMEVAFGLALNLGSVGSVIGHELTHAFDDSGSKFNAEGKLQDWWSLESRRAFENATQCMQNQYGNYSFPSTGEDTTLKVNGKLTLGENIADNGGFNLALKVLKQMVSESERKQQLIIANDSMPSFTVEQFFMLSWAQTWCTSSTHAALKHRLGSDPHSPGKFRAVGVFENSHQFAEAFGCPKLTDACGVW